MKISLHQQIPAGWLVRHWRHGRSVLILWRLTQSSKTLSTQLAKFPQAGCYHVSPMLQNSHGLLECTLANPHFATIPFSLEPSEAATWRKTPHRFSSESMVTQLVGTKTRKPNLVSHIKSKSSDGDSWQICHLNQGSPIATSCPPTVSIQNPVFLSSLFSSSPIYLPSDWFLYSLEGSWISEGSVGSLRCPQY